MSIWVLIGLTITATTAAVLLRTTQPAFALSLTVLAGVTVLIATVGEAVPLIERLTAMLSRCVPASEHTGVFVKALGIAVLTQSAADVCRDAGESALAGKTELAGNVLLLICGLPLYEYALTLLENIMIGQAVSG